MITCPFCGVSLSDDADFCTSCGNAIEKQPVNNGFQANSAAPMGNPQMNYQQPMYQQPMYQQPMYQQPMAMPNAIKLKTNRSLLTFILLSLVTFGIYGLVVLSSISSDINTIAGRYDGKKTTHYILMILVTPFTLGIYPLIWYHSISDRIGNELRRRGIGYSFDSSTFWLWNVLGSLILIGPFVYMHKWFEAMNQLSNHYNTYGY